MRFSCVLCVYYMLLFSSVASYFLNKNDQNNFLAQCVTRKERKTYRYYGSKNTDYQNKPCMEWSNATKALSENPSFMDEQHHSFCRNLDLSTVGVSRRFKNDPETKLGPWCYVNLKPSHCFVECREQKVSTSDKKQKRSLSKEKLNATSGIDINDEVIKQLLDSNIYSEFHWGDVVDYYKDPKQWEPMNDTTLRQTMTAIMVVVFVLGLGFMVFLAFRNWQQEHKAKLEPEQTPAVTPTKKNVVEAIREFLAGIGAKKNEKKQSTAPTGVSAQRKL